MNKTTTLIIAVIVIIVLIIIGVIIYIDSKPNNPIACPALAQLCSDGSSVGMIAVNGKCVWQKCPNCECPNGYIQEGNACNPKCYYSTPKCLMPSLICKNVSS